MYALAMMRSTRPTCTNGDNGVRERAVCGHDGERAVVHRRDGGAAYENEGGRKGCGKERGTLDECEAVVNGHTSNPGEEHMRILDSPERLCQ